MPRRAALTRALLALAVAALACADGTGPAAFTNRDPARAPLVTSDLANFVAVFDASDWSAAAFSVAYLAPASAGLREFIDKRDITAASVANMVRTHPAYLATARHSMLQLHAGTAMKDRLRADFVRMKELYADAVFPPVTFLVGRFSTGGTIGSTGLLIGMEFYGATENAPNHELSYFERMNARQFDSLPFIVAHELTHVQQAVAGSRASQGTLLEQSLMEGGADFVGELVSGGIVNGRLHVWALEREAAVWADFQDEMHGRDVSRWLYNQGSETFARPGDLGYFVGYRIAQAYYARATDKRAALREIIRMRDVRAMLDDERVRPALSGGRSRS